MKEFAFDWKSFDTHIEGGTKVHLRVVEQADGSAARIQLVETETEKVLIDTGAIKTKGIS